MPGTNGALAAALHVRHPDPAIRMRGVNALVVLYGVAVVGAVHPADQVVDPRHVAPVEPLEGVRVSARGEGHLDGVGCVPRFGGVSGQGRDSGG